MEQELLTADEKTAIRLAGELYTLIVRDVIGTGLSGPGDIAELAALIHGIQHMVMAQAAARAYPHDYRLLGGVLEPKPIGDLK